MEAFEDAQDVYRFIPSLEKRFLLSEEKDFFAGCTGKDESENYEAPLLKAVNSSQSLAHPLTKDFPINYQFTSSGIAFESQKRLLSEKVDQMLEATMNDNPVIVGTQEASLSDIGSSHHKTYDRGQIHGDFVSKKDTKEISSFQNTDNSRNKYQNNFQCSFKYTQQSEKVINTGWPESSLIQQKDDSDLIDLFFSHSEPQENFWSQNNSSITSSMDGKLPRSGDIGSESKKSPSNNTKLIMDSSELRSITEISSLKNNSSSVSWPSHGKTFLEVLQTKHGEEWPQAHITDLLDTLRDYPGNPSQPRDMTYRPHFSHDNLPNAIRRAQANQSWGEAFILAHLCGLKATQKLIEEYIEQKQGTISPSLHEILAFDYIIIDTEGLRNDWVDYLEIAIVKFHPSEQQSYIEKLISALIANSMHDEADVCTQLQSFHKKSRYSPEESEIRIASVNKEEDNKVSIDNPMYAANLGDKFGAAETPSNVVDSNTEKNETTFNSDVSERSRWTLMEKENNIFAENSDEIEMADTLLSHNKEQKYQQTNHQQAQKWWPFQSKKTGAKSIILPEDDEKPYFNPETKKWENVSVENDSEFTVAVNEGPPKIISHEDNQAITSDHQGFYTSPHGLNLRYADTFNV